MSSSGNKTAKEKFFRFGIAAKGLVYSLIGGLTLTSAWNLTQEATGQKQVIEFLQEQPFGNVLLVLIALGLFAYCAWRLYTSFTGDNDGKKEIAESIGHVCSGLFYGALAVFSLSLIFTEGGGSNGSAKTYAETVMQNPGGRIAIGILGAIFIGVGMYQFLKGWQEKYLDALPSGAQDSMSNYGMYKTLGKVGYIARSVVYWVIAWFLLNAALSSDAQKVKGMEGVFEFIKELSLGGVLVLLLALGLLAHGLFMFVKAKYGEVEG